MGYREHISTINSYAINCFDLDEKILKPEFPRWEHGGFHQAKEALNDTYIEVTVEYGIQDDYDRECFDKYVATGEDELGYGLPDVLLSDMCGRGLIDAGLYLVKVSW